jgi:hypothetical protein
MPAKLLSTPLVWVRRGGLVPPLQLLYDSPYAVLRLSLLLHYQSRVAGRGGCGQPPEGLNGRGRHAWQPTLPAPRQSYRNQAGLVFIPAGFFTFSFIGAATRRSRNRFPTWRGGFCMPGTGGAFTASTEEVPAPKAGTAQEVGPLTSSPPS